MNSQFSSVTHFCPTLCDPMDCSTLGSLSTTNSQSLLKFMSIESVMPSNHLVGTERLSEEITTNNFPNLMTYTNLQIQPVKYYRMIYASP